MYASEKVSRDPKIVDRSRCQPDVGCYFKLQVLCPEDKRTSVSTPRVEEEERMSKMVQSKKSRKYKCKYQVAPRSSMFLGCLVQQSTEHMTGSET